jgi:hypothetical protein
MWYAYFIQYYKMKVLTIILTKSSFDLQNNYVHAQKEYHGPK